MTGNPKIDKRVKHPVRVQISKARLSGELHHRGYTLVSLARYLDKSTDTIKLWNRIGWPETHYRMLPHFLSLSLDDTDMRLMP